MKTNLKLNANTSIKNLETIARKAAALSKLQQKTKKRTAPKKKDFLDLNYTINSIQRCFRNALGKDKVIVIEKNESNIGCESILNVYNRLDLERQRTEAENYKRLLALGYDRKEIQKPFVAIPETKYAFYADPINPNRLGSVAIYGGDALDNKAMIEKSGHFFGLPVREVNIEVGRLLFVDVRFRNQAC